MAGRLRGGVISFLGCVFAAVYLLGGLLVSRETAGFAAGYFTLVVLALKVFGAAVPNSSLYIFSPVLFAFQHSRQALRFDGFSSPQKAHIHPLNSSTFIPRSGFFGADLVYAGFGGDSS